MPNERNKYFDEYLDSIFSQGVTLSPEEFDSNAVEYELQYGRFLPAARDAAILDAGCGPGHFLYFLKKRGYINFAGIDMSPQQIDYCRKHVSEKAVLADIFEYCGEKEGVFDLVVLNDVLEHIPKDKVVLFLSVLRRSLKTGGRLLLRTPNMGNFFSLYARYKDFTHELGFTERSLRQVLWLAGFRDMLIFGPEMVHPRTLKGKAEKAFRDLIWFLLIKLFWHQGYVAPVLMTPLLAASAVKQ
jgi:2-polyprenyl-3-methyl-5-hydroxy-6-metoxy-1,4-benzoquinol methylase